MVGLRGDPTKVTIKDAATAGAQEFIVSGNDLPINEWNELQPVDLLIRCTQADFKVYLNGKHIKTFTSSYWHADDGTLPKPHALKWTVVNDAELKKLAWTYSKEIVYLYKSYRLPPIVNGIVS